MPVPIKEWTRGVTVESEARAQLEATASLPIVDPADAIAIGGGVLLVGRRVGRSPHPIGSEERRRDLRAQSKARSRDRRFAGVLSIQCACGCGYAMSPIDAFGRPRSYVSGHNTVRKYEDPKQFKREWNHRNRPARATAKTDRFRRLKAKLLAMFGGACVDCALAYNGKNACVFHFHHRDPSTKTFALGNQLCNKAWQAIVAEARKCDLLCANCHELRHSGEF